MAEPRHDAPTGRSEILSPATRALVDHVLPAAARATGFEPYGRYGWGRDFWSCTLIHQNGFEAGLYADPPRPTRTSAENPTADAAGKRPTEPAAYVWADAFVLHPELTDDEWRVAGPAVQDLKRRRLCEGHYRDEAASPPYHLMIQHPHHGPLAVEPVRLFLFAFVRELYRVRASIPHAELWVPGPEHLDRHG